MGLMRELTARQLADQFGTLIQSSRRAGLNSSQLRRLLRDEHNVAVSDRKIRHAIKFLFADEVTKIEGNRVSLDKQDDDNMVAEAKGPTIQTLEGLLEACEVDTDVWRVDRYIVNKWDVFSNEHGQQQNFQVKAWLERRQDVVNWQAMQDELLERLSKPVKPLNIILPRGQHMIELDMSDLHVDKRPYRGERSLDDVGDETMTCLADILSQVAGLDIDQFNLIIGNDLFTAEPNGKTARGTEQDVYISHADAYAWTFDMKRQIIEMLRRTARVHGVVVGGNHDPHATMHLGHGLYQVFRDDATVTIDWEPEERKYASWGPSVFCYMHQPGAGGLKNMPALAGAEYPDYYQYPYRYIKLGHQHRKQMGIIQTFEEDHGIHYHWMRALSVVDSYHHKKGYTSLRGMEGYVYHKDMGPRGSRPAFVEV